MPTGSKPGETYPIRLFGMRFYADRNGNIVDSLTSTVLPKENAYGKFLTKVPEEVQSYAQSPTGYIETALLIALAFKDPAIPFRKMFELAVGFVDNNPHNLEPSNLVLHYPVGGMPAEFWPGFYHIPGYSHYLINKNGQVFSPRTGEYKNVSIGTNGYPELSMSDDLGKSRAVGIHRLVGLTFIPYPNTVAKWVVDHLDMNITNHSIDNLEWVTHAENVRRALAHPVRADVIRQNRTGVQIEIKDLFTDEILTFSSYADAGRHFNTTAAHVFQSVKNHAMKTIFKQKYVVKLADQEWPDITKDDIKNATLSAGGRPVLVKNLADGTITRYEKAAEFLRATGFSKKFVTMRLKKGVQKEIGGVLFKYADNTTEWIK